MKIYQQFIHTDHQVRSNIMKWIKTKPQQQQKLVDVDTKQIYPKKTSAWVMVVQVNIIETKITQTDINRLKYFHESRQMRVKL